MDLKDLTPKSDTVDITICHPYTGEVLTNKDGSNMTITMYAPHSSQYRKAVYEQTDKRIKNSQSNKKYEITAEELEEASFELLAKSTKTWNFTFDGEMPEYSATKAVELYKEVFWLKDQINEGLSNYLDFMKK